MKQIEDRMDAMADNSQKSLLIYIRDERFKNQFTNEYLDTHYPGYQQYHFIIIPDNGRSANVDRDKPYTISEL